MTKELDPKNKTNLHPSQKHEKEKVYSNIPVSILEKLINDSVNDFSELLEHYHAYIARLSLRSTPNGLEIDEDLQQILSYTVIQAAQKFKKLLTEEENNTDAINHTTSSINHP